MPAALGSGVIAGGPVRAISGSGRYGCHFQVHRPRNSMNIVRAVF